MEIVRLLWTKYRSTVRLVFITVAVLVAGYKVLCFGLDIPQPVWVSGDTYELR
jgi:hypothetical protein